MDSLTDRVDARLARMKKRKGYTEREARHFELWEKQITQRKPTEAAYQADVRHERLTREALEASRPGD